MTEKQALVLLICFILIWGGFALDLIIWKIKRGNAMREKQKGKFGVTGYKLFKGQWSFGFAITHDEYETYLYINLFKWSIAIGILDL
jgi:hypothetical protein